MQRPLEWIDGSCISRSKIINVTANYFFCHRQCFTIQWLIICFIAFIHPFPVPDPGGPLVVAFALMSTMYYIHISESDLKIKISWAGYLLEIGKYFEEILIGLFINGMFYSKHHFNLVLNSLNMYSVSNYHILLGIILSLVLIPYLLIFLSRSTALIYNSAIKSYLMSENDTNYQLNQYD